MSDDRIEPTIKSIDLEIDIDKEKKKPAIDTPHTHDRESALEIELESLGKELNYNNKTDSEQDSDNHRSDADSKESTFEKTIGKQTPLSDTPLEKPDSNHLKEPITDNNNDKPDNDDQKKSVFTETDKKPSISDELKESILAKTGNKSANPDQIRESVLEKAAEQFDTDDITETIIESDKKKKKKKDKDKKKDKNWNKDKNKKQEPSIDDISMQLDSSSKASPFEFKSSKHSSIDRQQKHAVDTQSWFSITGRIDRLRAGILLLMVSYLSVALIAFTDPFLKSIAGIFASSSASAKEFMFDPIIYISTGIGFWLLALLVIAMKRLRDANYNPLLGLLLFLPPISFLTLYYCMLPGTPNSNKYGAEPASYSYLTWIGFAVSVILIPILIYYYADAFTEYFWQIQNNLDIKLDKALE